MAQSQTVETEHKDRLPIEREAIPVAREILGELFGPPSERTFAVRLWDGSLEAPADRSPDFTLVIRRPGALRRMFMPPSELAVAEAYLRNDFDVQGSMEAATALAESIQGNLQTPATIARFAGHLLSLPTHDLPSSRHNGRHNGRARRAVRLTGAKHSQARDATAVRYHYDTGNDFYSLWLDRRMVYSCAYFETGNETIDAAQEAKLDLICRKLRLRPGETLLDIGCGWGGLIQFAAERYGVDATGITLSRPQASLANKRIADAGLADRCRVEVRDYRDMPQAQTFDKVVSVGMFEHVGRAKLPTYFTEAYRLTRPRGLFLNHGIVTLDAHTHPVQDVMNRVLWHGGEFIEKYVFPDGGLITPGEVLGFAERAGFETRDLESLREHYAMTLRHWIRRLEEHHDEAVRAAGEQTYRVWRLYMSSSAHGFASGRIGIVQVLLSKQDQGRTNLPLTRRDIHA